MVTDDQTGESERVPVYRKAGFDLGTVTGVAGEFVNVHFDKDVPCINGGQARDEWQEHFQNMEIA